jgi:hypothetical protein
MDQRLFVPVHSSAGFIFPFENHLSIPIIGRSPLRIKGLQDKSDIYFPALHGLHKYDTRTRALECVVKKDFTSADYVQIFHCQDGSFICLEEYTKPYSAPYSKNTSTYLEKYDTGFKLVTSRKINYAVNTVCAGEQGVIVTHLDKAGVGGYPTESFSSPMIV